MASDNNAFFSRLGDFSSHRPITEIQTETPAHDTRMVDTFVKVEVWLEHMSLDHDASTNASDRVHKRKHPGSSHDSPREIDLEEARKRRSAKSRRIDEHLTITDSKGSGFAQSSSNAPTYQQAAFPDASPTKHRKPKIQVGEEDRSSEAEAVAVGPSCQGETRIGSFVATVADHSCSSSGLSPSPADEGATYQCTLEPLVSRKSNGTQDQYVQDSHNSAKTATELTQASTKVPTPIIRKQGKAYARPKKRVQFDASGDQMQEFDHELPVSGAESYETDGE
ncbi:uncharacterized protein LTR77_001444 [Saxophila tyrrhenica]|uniref:Uncharacterized protein n=1 Tax=Saxophila tyrrhenica TaxID=1690608 RepID=A0AAV9PQ01_9PEZI|nr:hypothetical protein LTR77_001444 [Saxophila tyrrhenica]